VKGIGVGMEYICSYNTSSTSSESSIQSYKKIKSKQLDNTRAQKGRISFQKGQKITGVVVAVGDSLVLDFNGEKVKASKDLIKGASVGQVYRFEVGRVTEKLIELKILDSNEKNAIKVSMALITLGSEKMALLASKKDTIQEKEKNLLNTKHHMEEISAKLTKEDIQFILKEGFQIHKLSVEELYHGMLRAKEHRNHTKKDSSTFEKKTYDKEDIEKILAYENLPNSKENIQLVSSALEMSKIIPHINKKTIKYLIKNDMKPTIENLYKAFYNGNVLGQEENHKAFHSQVWEDLQPQMKEIMEAAGYELNDESLDDAKWLLENGLALTKNSFQYKKDMDQIKNSYGLEKIFDQIIQGMKQGMAPKDVLVSHSDFNYEDFIKDLNSITDKTVEEAVGSGMELSIHRLWRIQRSFSEPSTEYKETLEIKKGQVEKGKEKKETIDIEAIKAKRQLEEIRLKMTREVAYKLEKKGIQVRTERLEKVVEALRELEDQYYKDLLKAEHMDTSEQNIHILKETTIGIARLKTMPEYLLGTTLSQRWQQTIPSLLEEGNILRQELLKAGEAYETMLTVPNQEYGDSIQKAFQNVDHLLNEMKLEITRENQRAVRILAYNGMEINLDNITQIKAYDMEINYLMENLQSATILRLIKEKKNPLHIPIDELNQEIDRINQEDGIDASQKFSTYLRNLEKDKLISDQERKAYIGVFRLLYQLEKSDGAALGSVLKSGREVTLNHLLSAIRTRNKSINTIIDDEFGLLEGLTEQGESISEQIEKGFLGKESILEVSSSLDEVLQESQEKYYNRMLQQIRDRISPQKLTSLQQEIMSESQDINNILRDGEMASASRSGLWDSIKDLSLERLNEKLINPDLDAVLDGEENLQKIQEIQEIYKNSDSAIRFLNSFKIPNHTGNIILANHILSNGESPIKRLLKIQKENSVEKDKINLKEKFELADKLNDENSMAEAYDHLEKLANQVVDQACQEEKIDYQKLSQLRNILAQVSFLKTLAKREFYQIPVETEAGTINLNVTINRNREAAGRVSVSMACEKLGEVKADFILKNNFLTGFIACDNREGLDRIKGSMGILEQLALEENINIKSLDFGIKPQGTINYNIDYEEEGDRRSDKERQLYRIAKSVVRMVQTIHNH